MSEGPQPPPSDRHPPGWLGDAERVDEAVYSAIARTPTPSLDAAMRRLSRAADYSKLSLLAAGALAASGRRGRRAAIEGLVSVGVTATFVNVVAKPLSSRERPDRAAERVAVARHVRMPISTSFPSGHSAAAFAFAGGAGHAQPGVSAPLHGLAALVAYSRVHTGVHYPGDALVGSLIGVIAAQGTTFVLERLARGRS